MLRIQCLGALRVWKGDEEVTNFASQPVRASLLACLSVERQIHRDKLCLFFWPDSSPNRARHALSQTLYALKKELGEGWLGASGGRLIATDEVQVDLLAFTAAVDAGRYEDADPLYVGPFLDGIAAAGGVDFEHWVEETRTRVHGLARRTYGHLVSASRDREKKVELARRWVRLDPLDDESQHALIDALAGAGKRSDALEQYRIYAELIKAELDVVPLDHTLELVERIRAGDPPSAGELVSSPTSPTGVATDAVTVREGSFPDFGPELHVLRLIGRGTTGAVYLVREPALKRLVAVKVLDAALATDGTARARFEREAQAAARIVHPNVATVLRVGVTGDGAPFLVMQYVKGGTLADRIEAHGPFSPDEVRRILGTVASALAAAHAGGVIHRDVRPANILYDERTTSVYLADFGIAGVLESGDEEIIRLTRSGELLGNVEYVSPEQARGEGVDDRSDVYSLGVLGWALLLGQPTSEGELAASDVVRDAQLTQLLRHATAKTPWHRPSASDLARALSGEALHPPGPVGGLFREFRRRRLFPFVGAYAAAGAAGMGVVDQLVQQRLLSPISYRLALTFFVAGLCAAVVLSWFHGEKGRQRSSRGEMVLLTLTFIVWIAVTVLLVT